MRSDLDFKLTVVQEPFHARMSGGFGKKVDRRPVDPPPIIKLDVLDHLDIPVKPRNASSSIFMIACAIRKNDFEDNKESHFYRDDGKTLACIGANVSSIHCLRDTEGKEGLYFIFPDFSIRSEGIYKIKCMLYERTATGAVFRGSVCTQPFPVQTAKQFMGMQESSALSRAFADQGIKLRIRSSPRISSNAIAAGVGKKRKNDDMAEKKYKQKSLDLEQRQFKIPADTVKLIRTSLQYSSSVHSPLNPNARSPLLAHSVPTIISSSHYHNNHYVPTPRASVSDNGGGSGYSSPKHGILEALSKPDMHTYQLPTPTLSHRSSLGSTYTSSNGSSSAPSSVPSSTHSSAPSSAASSTTSTYLPGTPAKQVRLPSFSHFLNSGKRPTLPSLSSNQVLYSLQEEPFSYEEENNIRY